MMRPRGGGGLVALVAILALVFAVVTPVALIASREDRTITVESKERVCDSRDSNGDQECRYLVFTDQGTFQVTDSWLAFRFNSSDVYGKLKDGRTYVVRVQGFRLPFLSKYPNIIKIKSEVAQ